MAAAAAVELGGDGCAPADHSPIKFSDTGGDIEKVLTVERTSFSTRFILSLVWTPLNSLLSFLALTINVRIRDAVLLAAFTRTLFIASFAGRSTVGALR